MLHDHFAFVNSRERIVVVYYSSRLRAYALRADSM